MIHPGGRGILDFVLESSITKVCDKRMLSHKLWRIAGGANIFEKCTKVCFYKKWCYHATPGIEGWRDVFILKNSTAMFCANLCGSQIMKDSWRVCMRFLSPIVPWRQKKYSFILKRQNVFFWCKQVSSYCKTVKYCILWGNQWQHSERHREPREVPRGRVLGVRGAVPRGRVQGFAIGRLGFWISGMLLKLMYYNLLFCTSVARVMLRFLRSPHRLV